MQFWGLTIPSLLAQASFGNFFALFINFFYYFLWRRTTNEGSIPEMCIWSILLIKSNLKWCIHLSKSLYLYLIHVWIYLHGWTKYCFLYLMLNLNQNANKKNFASRKHLIELFLFKLHRKCNSFAYMEAFNILESSVKVFKSIDLVLYRGAHPGALRWILLCIESLVSKYYFLKVSILYITTKNISPLTGAFITDYETLKNLSQHAEKINFR